MLVCLLGLWQGMGWADNDDTSTIGNSAKDVRTVTPEEFDYIIESEDIDYAIGIITDGKRWAYHSSVHPIYTLEATNYTVYCPDAYYDVTGNGKMDFFGYYKEIKANCNMYPLIVTSIDGDLIRKEGTGSHVSWATDRYGKLEYYQKDDYAKYGTLDYGFIGFKMGMYDKDGMPLLINCDAQYNFPTCIYSYKQNKIVLKAENFYYSKTTFADINGDGRKEIISFVPSKYNSSNTQLTEEDGVIDIYRMAADGTFVADKIYVTSDTTVIKSMMLDDYTPNSGTIDKPGSGTQTATGIGYPGQGMFVEAKPAPDWNDWQEYDNITSETSQAKQVITNNGKATRAMAAQTGYVSAADINGDGMIDLYDGTNIYYNLGRNKFFKSAHRGTIYSADLTGNGLLDFIDFGNEQVDLYLSMAENSDMQVKTLLKNTAISNTFFGDFDKDGDVDILFVIPGSDYTIFQFYRNDGNGVFKPKDTNLDGTYTCQACNDYDGDGLYEILAVNKGTYKNVLLKLNNKWSVAETELPYPLRTIGDVNNDGTMEMVYNNSKKSYTIYDAVPNCKVNTRPEK